MPSTLDPDTLRAEIEAARELFQRGNPVLARQRFRAILNRLARLADERPSVKAQRARLLVGLAAADFEVTGDFDEAMSLLDRAEADARGSGSDALTASMNGQRGLLLLRRGETTAALHALDAAVRCADNAPPYDRMTLLLNRGALHLERGSPTRAAEDFERCVALAEEHGERLLEFKARHNLGYAQFLAGRLPRALRALETAERINPGELSPVSLLDRARVLREAGLVPDADALLARVAQMFERSKLMQDLAETELVRAECALVEDRYQHARALAAAAQRRFARRGNLRWQRKAELLGLRCERFIAEERDPGHRRTALRAVAARASELAVDCRREGRRDLARAADLLSLECRLRAGDEADRPVPPLRAGDSLQSRLQGHEVRALAAWQAGDHTRAAGEVRRGLGELGSYQHSFGSLDLRTASAVHGAALARLGLEVAMESGSPAAVLHLVEQARAVSTRLPQVRPPRDERTAELLSELRQVEEESRALEGEPTAGDRAHDLRLRAAHLQRDIRARAWEVEGEHGSASAAPRLTHVRQAAREADVAFLTYARHQGRWVAVCVCGSRSEVHDLASMGEVSDLVRRVRADLDALALTALPDSLRETVRRSLGASLARLDDQLLAPLRLRERPMVISCSGDLMFLPWGLLGSRLGISTVVTPSAASWLRQRGVGRPAAPDAVAVAGPDLRCAEREADVVAEVWAGSKTFAGCEATVAATHAALVTADLVHVAAHGRHRQDNPLFSSVRLVDGHLYAYEIDPAAGLPGCVVLSACEAGLATPRPGEESLGLSHVLLQLGTKSVIAGVARVGDDVSARLMEDMHRDMARGIDAASALAAAQRETLDGEFPAAFVCLGDTW